MEYWPSLTIPQGRSMLMVHWEFSKAAASTQLTLPKLAGRRKYSDLGTVMFYAKILETNVLKTLLSREGWW